MIICNILPLQKYRVIESFKVLKSEKICPILTISFNFQAFQGKTKQCPAYLEVLASMGLFVFSYSLIESNKYLHLPPYHFIQCTMQTASDDGFILISNFRKTRPEVYSWPFSSKITKTRGQKIIKRLKAFNLLYDLISSQADGKFHMHIRRDRDNSRTMHRSKKCQKTRSP